MKTYRITDADGARWQVCEGDPAYSAITALVKIGWPEERLSLPLPVFLGIPTSADPDTLREVCDGELDPDLALLLNDRVRQLDYLATISTTQ